MDQLARVSKDHPGWSLTEIKNLSVRERINWIKRENVEAKQLMERMGLNDG
jgi:hypothetical protein